MVRIVHESDGGKVREEQEGARDAITTAWKDKESNEKRSGTSSATRNQVFGSRFGAPQQRLRAEGEPVRRSEFDLVLFGDFSSFVGHNSGICCLKKLDLIGTNLREFRQLAQDSGKCRKVDGGLSKGGQVLDRRTRRVVLGASTTPEGIPFEVLRFGLWPNGAGKVRSPAGTFRRPA
jgi:hypothetical protein